MQQSATHGFWISEQAMRDIPPDIRAYIMGFTGEYNPIAARKSQYREKYLSRLPLRDYRTIISYGDINTLKEALERYPPSKVLVEDLLLYAMESRKIEIIYYLINNYQNLFFYGTIIPRVIISVIIFAISHRDDGLFEFVIDKIKQYYPKSMSSLVGSILDLVHVNQDYVIEVFMRHDLIHVMRKDIFEVGLYGSPEKRDNVIRFLSNISSEYKEKIFDKFEFYHALNHIDWNFDEEEAPSILNYLYNLMIIFDIQFEEYIIANEYLREKIKEYFI